MTDDEQRAYRFIRQIRLVKRSALYIDGERIDWYLADEDIEITAPRDGLSVVRIPLLAENVSVEDPIGIGHIGQDDEP